MSSHTASRGDRRRILLLFSSLDYARCRRTVRLSEPAGIWQICSHLPRSLEPTCLRYSLDGCPQTASSRSTIVQRNGHLKRQASILYMFARCMAAFETGPRSTVRYTSTSISCGSYFSIPEFLQEPQTWWVV